MLASDIPAFFPSIWAVSAGPGYVRTIPANAPGGGAAGWDIGYPPENFVPPGSGGTPPFGQDFNGVDQIFSAWLQWAQAGAPVGFDSTFSTSIGGYPKAAIIQTADADGTYWYCTADANTTDPDAAGAGWKKFSPIQLFVLSTGNNTIVATFSPAPASLDNLTGRVLLVQKNANPNTGAVTLNPNGLGATPVVNPDGSPLIAAQLPANSIFAVAYDGSTNFYLLSSSGVSGITNTQLQAQAGNYADDTGAANAYVCALTPALSGHVTGMPIRVLIAHDNTGASTFDPGPGAKNIKTPAGTDPLAGQLYAGAIVTFVYDGTDYQVTLPPAKQFDTGAITVPTAGFSSTPAHGLGGLPRRFSAFISCISADAGYASGDCVAIGSGYSDAGSSRGASIYFTTTVIGINVGTNGIRVPSGGGGGAMTAIDETKWRLHIFAER